MVLHIQVEKKGNASIIRAKGQVDMTTSVDLATALEAAMETDNLILLDFTAVPAIDSSGIGAVVRIAEKIKMSGKKLCIFGLSNQLKKLFWVLKLDKNLAIFETESQAMAGQTKKAASVQDRFLLLDAEMLLRLP